MTYFYMRIYLCATNVLSLRDKKDLICENLLESAAIAYVFICENPSNLRLSVFKSSKGSYSGFRPTPE